ncbi:MAG: hypothetical protein HZC17_09195 [Candidatus Omnitrophica bacterium]|nr:hypothetical protein [Candidatus Omnitrophota bacterium]
MKTQMTTEKNMVVRDFIKKNFRFFAFLRINFVRTKKLTNSQIQNGEDSIEEAIKRVDAEIGKMMDEIENES